MLPVRQLSIGSKQKLQGLIHSLEKLESVAFMMKEKLQAPKDLPILISLLKIEDLKIIITLVLNLTSRPTEPTMEITSTVIPMEQV